MYGLFLCVARVNVIIKERNTISIKLTMQAKYYRTLCHHYYMSTIHVCKRKRSCKQYLGSKVVLLLVVTLCLQKVTLLVLVLAWNSLA